jgi:hypothetical protein
MLLLFSINLRPAQALSIFKRHLCNESLFYAGVDREDSFSLSEIILMRFPIRIYIKFVLQFTFASGLSNKTPLYWNSYRKL